MTFWTLIRHNLRYHARAHASVCLGVAVATATLTGALLVGDSVRESLRERALRRLADASHVVAPENRTFRKELQLAGAENITLLRLPATASTPDGGARASQVQVVGAVQAWSVPRGEAHLNEALARRLRAKVGDTVILRLAAGGASPLEAAVRERRDQTTALRVQVSRIITNANQGAFLQLESTGREALNAFVNYEELARRAELQGRANVLLLREPHGSAAQAELERALTGSWSLADAELYVRPGPGFVQLSSPRVFLDRSVEAATERMRESAPSTQILTYLATSLRAGTNLAPYSMITAAGPPWTPEDLKPDEIVLTDWLAEDLSAKPGEQVQVTWFIPDSGASLVETSRTFRVRGVVPLKKDLAFMPDFPGIEKAENTSDWDAGFPLVHKTRPKDERFWDEFKGTPKAFIGLETGRALWSNRYGALTAVRFPVPAGIDPMNYAERVSADLREGLTPAVAGLQVIPVRSQALSAAAQAQDFGQLFLGFSFFLLAAALLLVALLFRLGLEQRAAETGTLLALGYSPARVRRLVLMEAAVPVLAGAAAGALGGVLYARAMVWGLQHLWQDATGAFTASFHYTVPSLATGFAASVVVAVLTLLLVLRKQAAQPASRLLAGKGDSGVGRGGRRSSGMAARWFATGMITAGLILAAGTALSGGMTNAGAFFAAGSLVLAGGLIGLASVLKSPRQGSTDTALSLTQLGWRGTARRSSRSVATVALLACGVYMIVAVGAFRQEAARDGTARGSGTGGFGLIALSTLPILQDLTRADTVRKVAGTNVTAVVPLRVRAGDEASCLNLDRVRRPQLLGVRPELLRGRFTFTKAAPGLDRTRGWELLRPDPAEPGVIPAIGDANSLQWALGKKPGDMLEYTDEQGRSFRVKLVAAVANSILQGSLVVDERAFLQRYPGESGWRQFLVEGDAAGAEALVRTFEDQGLETESTIERLNSFNAVQNTYLGAFGVLGGLGLLLGSAGLGVVVMRNVLERRAELAVLLAAGFRTRWVHGMVLREHALLLALGLALGTAAAAIAVLPAWLSAATGLPWGTLSVVLAAVGLNGMVWAWIATRIALRGKLLEALRGE